MVIKAQTQMPNNPLETKVLETFKRQYKQQKDAGRSTEKAVQEASAYSMRGVRTSVLRKARLHIKLQKISKSIIKNLI